MLGHRVDVGGGWCDAGEGMGHDGNSAACAPPDVPHSNLVASGVEQVRVGGVGGDAFDPVLLASAAEALLVLACPGVHVEYGPLFRPAEKLGSACDGTQT